MDLSLREPLTRKDRNRMTLHPCMAANQHTVHRSIHSKILDIRVTRVDAAHDLPVHGIYEIVTLGKHYYRPIGAEPVDVGDAIKTTINETIDATVFDRWRVDSTYRPQNLATWGSRRGVDPGTLKHAVLAKDATPIAEAIPQPGAAQNLPTTLN
jgi:hypothetical protein